MNDYLVLPCLYTNYIPQQVLNRNKVWIGRYIINQVAYMLRMLKKLGFFNGPGHVITPISYKKLPFLAATGTTDIYVLSSFEGNY